MNLIPHNDNPVIVALVGATGIFQSFFEFSTPLVQLLISIFTLLFVFQRWRNEKKKSK